MYNIGFWVGSHILMIIPIALMVAGLVISRECWIPSVRQLFTAIGPGLAQLGVRATRPPKVDTVADHVADLEFWLNAQVNGTPAEQAIAPQVLQALGYTSPEPQARPPSSQPFLVLREHRREHLLHVRNTTTNPDVRDDCNWELSRLEADR